MIIAAIQRFHVIMVFRKSHEYRAACGAARRYEGEISFWRNLIWFKVNGSWLKVKGKWLTIE